MLCPHDSANIQRCDCYSVEMFFFFASTNLAYTAHLNTHSPLHILYSEISIMSSRSCSHLFSEFKALCEACRLSKVQVCSDGSSDLVLFTLSFFVLRLFENVYIVSSVILCFLLSVLLFTHNHIPTWHM